MQTVYKLSLLTLWLSPALKFRTMWILVLITMSLNSNEILILFPPSEWKCCRVNFKRWHTPHRRLNESSYKSSISLFALGQTRQTGTSLTQSEEFLSPEKEINEVRNFFVNCENSIQSQAYLMGIQRQQLADIPSGAFTERVGKWKRMLT